VIGSPYEADKTEVDMTTSTLEAPALPVVDPEDDLTLSDRCDRDGEAVQAFYKFKKVLANGDVLTLNMCAHHGRHHEPAAIASGWTVFDYSHRLNEKPTDPDIDDI
jgi:hypothetical protein